MTDSTAEGLRQAREIAADRLTELMREFVRTSTLMASVRPMDVQGSLDALGTGLLDYVDVLTGPAHEIIAAHRELAEQMERWAHLQGEMAEQIESWAVQQQQLADSLGALLAPMRPSNDRSKSAT